MMFGASLLLCERMGMICRRWLMGFVCVCVCVCVRMLGRGGGEGVVLGTYVGLAQPTWRFFLPFQGLLVFCRVKCLFLATEDVDMFSQWTCSA